jgi:ornithine carbamoyltransferase
MTTQASELRSGFSKDLLSLGELSPSEFQSVLQMAEILKNERQQRKFVHQAPGTSLALIFEKPSTRTRVSFEVAMYELGGHAVVLNSKEMQLSRGETPEDTGKVLSLFCHAIAARVYSHETLERLSSGSIVPVINALSNLYHPCQTLADFLTIKQFKKKLKGITIAWVGDGNNVCNSLLIGAALSGANITVACPRKYSPLPEALDRAGYHANFTGSQIAVTESPREAVKNADVIVTDTFVSMGEEDEKEEKLKLFLPEFQVNEDLLSLTKEDAIFMHCLPAHRGEEVTDSVIDGPQSVVWQEAENRLHTQKALLYSLLRRSKGPKDKVLFGN